MANDRITLADDAAPICEDVIARYFAPETRYQYAKVPALVSNISEAVVERLSKEAKLPRKYIAHVTILQKVGSGLQAVSSCSWNAGSDACYVHLSENSAMRCIVTVYGVTM